MNNKELDSLAVSTIRALCIDEINKAKSGHPGMALGSAPIMYALFKNHIVATPEDSTWFNRDRFVLSAGHASALLYVMLHLCGYKITMDDIKSFRQLGSKTPGHPEYKWTDGVDATSGPLGQGIAQAVGMAVAEQYVQASYKEGEKLSNHYTYCLCGDGCLEEGLSQEAISFAGTQKLNKLILIYDKNNVTLDGNLALSNSDNPTLRFYASNWNVIEVKDGNNVKAIDKAIAKAKKSKDYPTVIIVNTIIGYGSAKAGTCKVHGNPLGEEDGNVAKASYGYKGEPFTVCKEVQDVFDKTFKTRGHEAYVAYNKSIDLYKTAHPDEYKNFVNASKVDCSKYIGKKAPKFEEGSKVSTRVASGKYLNLFNSKIPFMLGGSADVAGSVMTKIEGGVAFDAFHRDGHVVNYGIREFAMAAIQNGMLLHGGVRPYGGCFLVFSDYLKPAIRMAALSKLPAIYLFSHDTIAVGEDGPTHQPIEQLTMLRSIPNTHVIRPCDERETYAAWANALSSQETPTCLILSRQNLPLLKGSDVDGVNFGGYIISKEKKKADVTIIASGSEVSLAIEAQEKLFAKHHIDARVVSMPSLELFKEQGKKYMDKVIGVPYEKRFAVEMLSPMPFYEIAKNVMGMETFGVSAPANDAIKHFEFNSDRLVKMIVKSK